MSENRASNVHNVIIEQCKKINMTGVNEVKAFDDETVVLDTACGTLTVKGDSLIINSFSASTGDLLMEGQICGFAYFDGERGKGALKRLFK